MKLSKRWQSIFRGVLSVSIGFALVRSGLPLWQVALITLLILAYGVLHYWSGRLDADRFKYMWRCQETDCHFIVKSNEEEVIDRLKDAHVDSSHNTAG